MTQEQAGTTAAGNPLIVPELTDDGIPYFVPIDRADTLVRCQRCGAATEGDTVAQAQAHVRDDHAGRRGGPSGCADRSPALRPTDHDALRPRPREPRPARELHPRGVHERGDQLDRHAAALATLAGSFRRTFMRGAR